MKCRDAQKSIKRKTLNKSRKTNKSNKLNKLNKLNKTRKFKKIQLMKGGDDRSTGLPAAYFNSSASGLNGYFSPGSSELKPTGGNVSVSRGTIWPNGQMTGPNSFPSSGGGCGCNKKNKNKKSKSKSNKNKKSKSNKSKKSRN